MESILAHAREAGISMPISEMVGSLLRGDCLPQTALAQLLKGRLENELFLGAPRGFVFLCLVVGFFPAHHLLNIGVVGSLPPLRRYFIISRWSWLYGYCDAVAVRDTIPRYWTTKSAANRLLYCRGMNRLGDDGLSTHYAAGGFCVAAKLA